MGISDIMKEQNTKATALMMETLREHRRMSVKLRARFYKHPLTLHV